jgi:hypothetical protein
MQRPITTRRYAVSWCTALRLSATLLEREDRLLHLLRQCRIVLALKV